MTDVLIIIFFVIFGATAILTILSLPGWIEIPEWYKQKLFVALILEVIASVLILFRSEIIGENNVADGINKIDPNTVLISSLQSSGGMNVHRPDSSSSVAVGVIPKDSLEKKGIFNSIEPSLWQSINNPVVKWERGSSGWYQATGSDIEGCPFAFEVYENKKGLPHYKIVNKQVDSIIYSSESRSVSDVFHTDNRLLHYYRDNQSFYMYRITEANPFSVNAPYVYVLQVKLEASLNGDDK